MILLLKHTILLISDLLFARTHAFLGYLRPELIHLTGELFLLCLGQLWRLVGLLLLAALVYVEVGVVVDWVELVYQVLR